MDAGAPVDGLPGETETPLMTAASYGGVDLASVLIDAGVNLEARPLPRPAGCQVAQLWMHAAVFGMTDVLDS